MLAVMSASIILMEQQLLLSASSLVVVVLGSWEQGGNDEHCVDGCCGELVLAGSPSLLGSGKVSPKARAQNRSTAVVVVVDLIPGPKVIDIIFRIETQSHTRIKHI
jgi:hypothetical protein